MTADSSVSRPDAQPGDGSAASGIGLPEIPANLPGLRMRAAAGLESGVCGGLVLLASLTAVALRENLRWYTMANLFGSVVSGSASVRNGAGLATLAGVAVVVFLYGLLGAMHGLLAGGLRGFWRAALLGISIGLIWHSLFFSSLFGDSVRLLAAHTPQPATIVLHLVYGLILGRTPRRLALLSRLSHRPEMPRPA